MINIEFYFNEYFDLEPDIMASSYFQILKQSNDKQMFRAKLYMKLAVTQIKGIQNI